MTSAALQQWKTRRADRLDRLLSARRAVRGVNRRWVTHELNHSLILRLAAEFQGFARSLHDEASVVVVTALAPNDPGRQAMLRLPYLAARVLDRGNARPEALREDFGRFGLELWPALNSCYPTIGPRWQKDLMMLNTARNGLSHDNDQVLATVLANGWSLTQPDIRRWRNTLDGLARGMDHVVGQHLHMLVGVRPW